MTEDRRYEEFEKADEYLREKYGEDYVKLRVVIDYLADQAKEEAMDYAADMDD